MLAGLILVLAALVPSTASASFHLTSIREVFIGNAPTDTYVELQFYSGGQQFLAGHSLTFYDATGSGIGSHDLTNAGNGDTQRTVLIGGAANVLGVPVDQQSADVQLLARTGGAVCFDVVDCVAWGTFTGSLNPPTGSPAPAIPAETALVRRIDRGCATLLEGSDDTNDSTADFALEPPNPRNNDSAPIETRCSGGGGGAAPQTELDKTPKKKITSKKAKFKFSSPADGARFECSLDGKPFRPCTSPHKVKVKPGKHTFAVRAVLDGQPDPSPATYKFKRVRK